MIEGGVTTLELIARPGPAVFVDAPSTRWLVTSRQFEIAAVVAGATAVWSASRIDLAAVGDVGLAPALPAPYWAALAGLNVAFMVALVRGATSLRTMSVLLGALIVTLFGVASIASPFPRLEPTWRHLGIIDYLGRGGAIDGQIDAYFNWPGFFSLSAAISRMAGLESLLGVGRWAPLWINGLWLVAASVPLKVLARDRRRFWLSLWVFCLGNWLDQDYFSPQAFALFVYLVIIGLTLWGLRTDVPRRLWERGRRFQLPHADVNRWWNARRPTGPSTGHQRSGLVLVVVLLGGATIVSHQLTPIVLVLTLTVIVVMGRSWACRLPVVIGMLLLAWLATGASSYLAGHPVLSFEALEQAAGANVVHRLGGSAGHVFVVRERMLLFLAMFGLAGIGLLRRLRAPRRGTSNDSMRVVPAALVVAPFLLVPANAYGGEMLLRATLFALPFLAVLISDAFPLADDSNPPNRARRAIASSLPLLLALVCTMWAAASVLARYGNARFDMFTRYEVEAVEEMYRTAPADGVLVSAAHPTPWRNHHYTEFRYTTFQEVCRTAPSADSCTTAVLARIGAGGRGGMIVVLRAGENSMRMQGLLAPEELASIEASLLSTPYVELVYENPDARLYAVGRMS